jgi:hypothetical protein
VVALQVGQDKTILPGLVAPILAVDENRTGYGQQVARRELVQGE